MIYLLISIAVIALDQYTKMLTIQYIPLGADQPLIDGILSFTFLKNTGSAFSLFDSAPWYGYFIMILTCLIAAVLIYGIIHYSKLSRWLSWGMGLVLGGALGNFIDRLHHGFVVDMIQTDFMNFPVFNVADIALCVGAACIFIYLIRDELKQRKKGETHDKQAD